MASSPPSLDDILETLRRRPGMLARTPAAAIEAALGQLRRVWFAEPRAGDGKRSMGEYRIDDLARAAGMTTRNVRAYQDRGLLPSPRRSGRVALYDDAHLARLKLIGSMLGRGYTTAHIAEMLHAWEHGKDLADVLGLEEALGKPWSDEVPTAMPLKDVRALAGDKENFDRLVALGLVRMQGGRAVVQRPQLLGAIAEMRGFGMPTSTVLDLYESVQPSIDDISAKLVVTATEHVASLKGAHWIPTGDELGELTTMLARFRELATTTVQQSLASSIEKTIERVLGAYLTQLAEDTAAKDAG
jgi:DNA-binding transcriptional MerR regulator